MRTFEASTRSNRQNPRPNRRELLRLRRQRDTIARRRVQFTAPVNETDLRLVVTQHSAEDHGEFQVYYRSHIGEVRTVQWLTFEDAVKRADLLRRRGYKVHVGPMVLEPIRQTIGSIATAKRS